MSTPSMPEPPGEQSGLVHSPPPLRLSWQELAALVSALAFAGFMWVRGVDLERAIFIAVCTVAALALMLMSPRAIAELVRALRELSRRLPPGGMA